MDASLKRQARQYLETEAAFGLAQVPSHKDLAAAPERTSETKEEKPRLLKR